MTWIFWAPAGAAVLHIVEEFVYPGGIVRWNCAYAPGSRWANTGGLLVLLNTLLLFACVVVGLAGPTPRGVAGWLTLASLLTTNAVIHLIAALRSGRYAPGLVTGIVLYVPMGMYGYGHFVGSGQASVGTAVGLAILGASYSICSVATHRVRARRRAKAAS